MELSDSLKDRVVKLESTAGRDSLGGIVSLHARLWTYGGPTQVLQGLALEQDLDVASLLRTIVVTATGTISEPQPGLLTTFFDNPLYALTTARNLQQRFLTFQRKTEPHQVVLSILISGSRKQTGSGSETMVLPIAPAEILANGTSAQILVSEAVYESVKGDPGFKFNPKPVRESGGTGGPEAIYELLWTDESTYGHLRQIGANSSFKTVGRYQIQQELGRGAMGVVYKAYDQLIGRTVALKTIEINRNAPDRDELVERLKQEAKAAGGLDHPNIITIYDVGQEDDLVYLSMQFVEGKTLLDVMAEGSLPTVPVLVSYAEQILSAVGFAHAGGVIHRDLKPANLMLTTQGVIKVLDFGIAKVENASLTQTGLVVGTPSHMAPEQVAGKKVDHRADIFALGSVFYEMVTHEKPFRGDVTTILYKIMHEDPVAPALINPALPGGIDAIIRKALAKDPNERFQSCEEMRDAFLEQGAQADVKPTQVLPSHPPVAKPAAQSPSFPHYLLEEVAPKKSSYMWFNLVIIALLGILATTVWAFYARASTGFFPRPLSWMLAAFHHSEQQPQESVPSQNSSVPASDPDPNSSIDPASAESAATTLKQPSTDNSPSLQAPGNSVVSSATPLPASTATNVTGKDKSQMAGDNDHVSPVSTSSTAPSDQARDVTVSPIVPNQPQGTTSGSVSTAGLSGNQAKPQASGSAAGDSAQLQLASKPANKPVPEPPSMVDGFTRRDVPELLRQADAAAARNDSRLAQYEYALILKLDPTNAAARAALRRIPPESAVH